MAGPRYIADPNDAFLTMEMEGLTALYHRASGTTHILAPPAPQILAALGMDAGEPAEIADRLSQSFDLAAEDAPAAIAARLAELEAAGLVRRA